MEYSIQITHKSVLLMDCMLEWTTIPPTEPGVYQIVKKPSTPDKKIWKYPRWILYSINTDYGGVITVFGTAETIDINSVAYWLGPIPLAESPRESD